VWRERRIIALRTFVGKAERNNAYIEILTFKRG
jgi:hypothetical protein